MRVSDVAARLDVATSTAHRLLTTLAHRGFVEQDATRRYRLGPTLVAIGRRADRHDALRLRMHHALEDIVAALGETAHLGVLEGRSVRYLDAVESPRAVRVAARTGQSLPAHCSSIGKVLLAAMDDAALRRLYADETTLATRTARSVTTLDQLLTELDRCRRLGFAVNDGESEDDVISIAVPVRDDTATVVAAASVAAPLHRLTTGDATTTSARLRALLLAGAA